MTNDVESVREHPVLGQILRKAEDAAFAKGVTMGVAASVLNVLEARGIEVTNAQSCKIRADRDMKVAVRRLQSALHVAAADELFD